MRRILLNFSALMASLFAIGLIVCQQVSADIILAWDPNQDVDLVGYHVYRSTSMGGSKTRLTSNPITCGPADSSCATYTDIGVSLDVAPRLFYFVTAVDNSTLESGPSNEIDSFTPDNPTGLIVLQSGNTALLQWPAVDDAVAYQIERAFDAPANWKKVAITEGRRYRDKNKHKGLTYYRFKAIFEDGSFGEPSDIAVFESKKRRRDRDRDFDDSDEGRRGRRSRGE